MFTLSQHESLYFRKEEPNQNQHHFVASLSQKRLPSQNSSVQCCSCKLCYPHTDRQTPTGNIFHSKINQGFQKTSRWIDWIEIRLKIPFLFLFNFALEDDWTCWRAHFITYVKKSRFRARRTLIAEMSRHIFGDRQKGAIIDFISFSATGRKESESQEIYMLYQRDRHTYLFLENILCQAVSSKLLTEIRFHHAEHEEKE